MDWHQKDTQANPPGSSSRSFGESSQSHHKVVESMTLDDGSSLHILVSDAESEAEDSGETTPAVQVSQEESKAQEAEIGERLICEPDSSVTAPVHVHSSTVTAPTTSTHHCKVKTLPKSDGKQNSVSRREKYPGSSGAIKNSGVKRKQIFKPLEVRTKVSKIKQATNDLLGEQSAEKTVGKDLHLEKFLKVVTSSVSQTPTGDITNTLIQSSPCKNPGKKNLTSEDLKVQDPSVMSSAVVSAVPTDVIRSDERDSVKLTEVIEVRDDLACDEQLPVSSSVSGADPDAHTDGLDYIIHSRDLSTDVNQQSVGVFDVESVFEKIKKPLEADLPADSRASNTEDSDVLVSDTTCVTRAKESPEDLQFLNIGKEGCAESEESCPGDSACPPEGVGLAGPTGNDRLVILDVCSLADWSAV